MNAPQAKFLLVETDEQLLGRPKLPNFCIDIEVNGNESIQLMIKMGNSWQQLG